VIEKEVTYYIPGEDEPVKVLVADFDQLKTGKFTPQNPSSTSYNLANFDAAEQV
jgi:hypothetical protein